jgi:SynChlorMet cassette radical SAM/SPASM protein ScmF
MAETPQLTCLYAYLSSRCNCHCCHCWIMGAGPSRPTSEAFLGVTAFDQAVQEALPLGLKSVKFTGGEPTLHPQLPVILQIAHRHGLTSRMETNGIAINQDLAVGLAANGCSFVSVSLDSARPEVHDRIRGLTGAFQKALTGIDHLLAQSVRVQVIMTLMRANVGEMEDVLALASRIGVGSVKFNLLQPTLRGLDLYQSGEALSVDDILECRTRLEGELAGRRNGVEVFLDVPVAFRPLRRLINGDRQGLCGILSILGILADGHYALCGIGENVPDLVFGRVGKDSLAVLWRENPTLRAIREGVPDQLTGVCGRCLLSRACLGACIAQNYYRTGSLLGPYWLCEEALELGRFPEGRLKP